MEVCAMLCSYRNILAALSLPNKVCNSICSKKYGERGIRYLIILLFGEAHCSLYQLYGLDIFVISCRGRGASF
jgi:hypothetical protein